MFICLLSVMTAGCFAVHAQDVKKVEGRANFPGLAYIEPGPAIMMVATYDAKERPNVLMAVWGGHCENGEIKIQFTKKHKTSKNLKLKKAFTVSFATVPTIAQSDYLGTVSGDEEPDKVKDVGFTVHKSPNVDAPIIDQYPLALECEVISFDNNVLIGKVINTSADKSILDDDGNIDMVKMQAVALEMDSKTYYTLRNVIGRAWLIGNKYRKQ